MIQTLLFAAVTLASIDLRGFTVPWDGRYSRALEELSAAENDLERFYVLPSAAKASFEVGKPEEARAFAKELLELAPRFVDDWNYGNAIHDGHMVLGRVALTVGDVEAAKKELALASQTPGSPQLDTFGPNMSLAKDLLEHGQTDAVLDYFASCAKFWDRERGRLGRWRRSALEGIVPSFGANLLY